MKSDTMSSFKKKVLICGGTGFIGRNLVEHYAADKNYEVHATYFSRTPPDMKGVVFHKIDLRQPELLNQLMDGVDILIQAAATTSGSKDIVNSPSLHVTDNAVMNSYIMRAAAQNKIKNVIFFSCTVMYKNSDIPLSEKDFESESVHPKYFGVGWTKVYIEKICEFYSRLSETKFTVIRHSNIYGPYDKFDLEKSHVFGATVTKIMKSDGYVDVWGDGEETRDFLFVDDLVQFVDKAIHQQTTPFELVNVGFGENYSVKQLVNEIMLTAGKKLEVRFDSTKPTIKTHVRIDISKAQKIFDWKPETSLSRGIEKTLDWYKKNVRN